MSSVCHPSLGSPSDCGVKLRIDAQLSPALAPWITRELGLEAALVRDVGLQNAKDAEIFQRAKEANAIVMTKDNDFVVLLDRFGPPPEVLWITCGNTSNERMQNLLRAGYQWQ